MSSCLSTLQANKADTSTFRDSLLLILDLLYENQEYESCATLAKQLLTSSEVKSRIPNLEDLEIVFIFGVLSAFRMVWATSSAKTVKLSKVYFVVALHQQYHYVTAASMVEVNFI